MTAPQPQDSDRECGRRLRRAREGQGLSVQDIAAELHLSKHQIQALEEDDWERLPGRTYARGYLRAYARLMDLDPQELLAGAGTPDKEAGEASAADAARHEPGDPEPADVAARPARPGRRYGVWVTGLLVIGVLAGAVWQMVDEAPSLLGVLNALSGADEAANDGGSTTRFARPGHEAALAAAGAQGAVAASARASQAPAGGHQVVLEFEGESWVEVRDGSGERLLYRSFQAGRRIEIAGRPPFRVFLGDAGAVRVQYAGERVAPRPAPARRFARFTVGSNG